MAFFTDASDEDIARAYQTSAVAVLPSVYEDVHGRRGAAPQLLGLTLLEAMASATPMVCTNVGGLPEIVEDGVTGFVVPPNDSAALAERVSRLLDDPALARRRPPSASGSPGNRVAERCLAASARQRPDHDRRVATAPGRGGYP